MPCATFVAEQKAVRHSRVKRLGKTAGHCVGCLHRESEGGFQKDSAKKAWGGVTLAPAVSWSRRRRPHRRPSYGAVGLMSGSSGQDRIPWHHGTAVYMDTRPRSESEGVLAIPMSSTKSRSSPAPSRVTEEGTQKPWLSRRVRRVERDGPEAPRRLHENRAPVSSPTISLTLPATMPCVHAQINHSSLGENCTGRELGCLDRSSLRAVTRTSKEITQ